MGRFAAELYARAMRAVRAQAPAPVPQAPAVGELGPVEAAVAITAALCKRFEGFRSRPYLCSAGVPTIGYGATFYLHGTRVTLHDKPISQEAAERLLRAQVERVYLPAVLRLCPGLMLADAAKLAAIIDFTFNLGESRLRTSTLRRVVNAGDWGAVPAELLKWVYAAGKVLRGLQLRRQAEAALIAPLK